MEGDAADLRGPARAMAGDVVDLEVGGTADLRGLLVPWPAVWWTWRPAARRTPYRGHARAMTSGAADLPGSGEAAEQWTVGRQRGGRAGQTAGNTGRHSGGRARADERTCMGGATADDRGGQAADERHQTCRGGTTADKGGDLYVARTKTARRRPAISFRGEEASSKGRGFRAAIER